MHENKPVNNINVYIVYLKTLKGVRELFHACTYMYVRIQEKDSVKRIPVPNVHKCNLDPEPVFNLGFN